MKDQRKRCLSGSPKMFQFSKMCGSNAKRREVAEVEKFKEMEKRTRRARDSPSSLFRTKCRQPAFISLTFAYDERGDRKGHSQKG